MTYVTLVTLYSETVHPVKGSSDRVRQRSTLCLPFLTLRRHADHKRGLGEGHKDEQAFDPQAVHQPEHAPAQRRPGDEQRDELDREGDRFLFDVAL